MTTPNPAPAQGDISAPDGIPEQVTAMKIKKGCDASSSDFWYDLTKGGYLKPEEILADPKDVERVKAAIKLIEEFEQACEDQIDGFVQ